MRQWLMLAVLLIIYAGWLYIEQKFLRDPLYAMSVAHIKMFRGEHLPESKRKIVEKIMSAISHLGDKAGLWMCVQVSYHFQNQAHSFITGTQMCLFIFIS